MSSSNTAGREALQKAWNALRKGERREARYWAEKAASESPETEDAWLLLAAVASPRASLVYLEKALQINPRSARARKGMHWAIQRMRSAQTESEARRPAMNEAASLEYIPGRRPIAFLPASSEAYVLRRPALIVWMLIVACLAGGMLVGFRLPRMIQEAGKDPLYSLAQIQPAKATPSETPTETPLPTETPTTTPTPTFTPTPTPLPSDTPPAAPPQPEATRKPKKTPKPQNVAGPGPLPANLNPADLWIDVDLSSQTAYAMLGDEVVRSFVVSTGTWQHPTVTGIFRVYVKYRYADMSGPGYYLRSVPYVMYFYKDYGLHGTYWHNNFGTPMSHGCVNFSTEDAGWIYKRSSIGTVVSVHH